MYLNTQSGLTPTLDAITGMVDAAAQNRNQLRGLAPALASTGIPVNAPGQSILSRLIGVSSDGTPAGPAPAGASPQAPAAPASAGSLPAFAAGGTPGSISPNIQAALSYFTDKGLSPVAAQGLVGGFSRESGPNLDPSAVNKGSGASGIAQWLGSRSQGLQQFAQATGRSPTDFKTQLDYVWSELNGPERGTLAALKGATNPLQATVAALGFERPEGWSANNPIGAKDFGQRLAATVGLGGAGAPQAPGGGMPSDASAYAPSGQGAGSSPAGRAIAAATQPQAGPQPGPMPQATADQAQGPYGSLASARASFAPSQPQQQGPGAAAPPPQQVAQAPQAAPMQPQAPMAAPPQQATANGLPGGLTPDAIGAMIQNPATRDLGLQLWQQMLTPKPGFTLKPGEAQFDIRGHQIASLPNAPVTVAPGSALVDPRTGQPMFRGPPNLEMKQTGVDAFGQKTFGTFNPQTGAVGAVPGQPGGAGAPSVDPNLHGADYLATLPPQIAGQVKALAEGRMKMPTGMSANSPMAQHIRAAVLQYDPTFDAANADARFKTRTDFAAGGPSSAAATITAGNTAIQHLGELSDAAEKLQNGSIPFANAITHGIDTEMGGNTAGTQFNSVLSKYVEEMTKFYRGTGGTEADIERDIGHLSANMSPDQLRTAIQAQVGLLQGKVTALQDRWHQGMGPAAGDYPVIAPKSQAVLDRIAGRSPGAAPAPVDTSPLGQARAAIARGAPRAAVIQRLQQMGVNPQGL